MHILVAPDSFKGSLGAIDAANAIARGVAAELGADSCELCPVSDGGEGMVDVLLSAIGGARRITRVTGPLGEPVDTAWALLDDDRTAAIEMAAAAGLGLVPAHRRDPGRTTTFGVGEMIRAALDAGATRIVVGAGGSATCDGGAGAAAALGVRFDGPATITGSALRELRSIDRRTADPRLRDVELLIAADVENPLCGPEGAAAIYAPQKGATPQQVLELDAGLFHLAALIDGANPAERGAGAAGGLAFGLRALCGGRIVSGAELVLDAVGFEHRVQRADLVITGEGTMDGQSAHGKACSAVARAVARHGVPVIALIGAAGPGIERVRDQGISAWFCIADRPMDEATSIARTAELLETTARNLAAALHA